MANEIRIEVSAEDVDRVRVTAAYALSREFMDEVHRRVAEGVRQVEATISVVGRYSWGWESESFGDANARAKKLLYSFLDDTQRMTFERADYFDVISQSKHRFRIINGYSMNIYLITEDGRPLQKFCIVSSMDVPIYDQLLMQKLMIEHDERRFVMTAATSPLPFGDVMVFNGDRFQRVQEIDGTIHFIRRHG